jgi:hypothetical protein
VVTVSAFYLPEYQTIRGFQMEQREMGVHVPGIDSSDVLYTVKDKLTVIVDLFNFSETIEMHHLLAGFRKQTFAGLTKIIDECIDALDAVIPALKQEGVWGK